MKPIIIDMKDMSDSTEVYESRPNPFLVYTIYAIFIIFATAIVWACFFKLDDVVKGTGMFRGTDSIYNVSCDVSGKILECNVGDGDYVEEGNVLYTISIDSLGDTIQTYNDSLSDINDRLEMLTLYEESLDNNNPISEEYSKNRYYNEFVNRRALLMANISSQRSNISSQKDAYQRSIDSTKETIEKYTNKLAKLEIVKRDILVVSNSFDESDSYYYSMVNSYITSYNYNKLQYDNKLAEYRAQIAEYNSQISNALSADSNADVESIKKQKSALETTVRELENEESKALNNLCQSQIATIEQTIESYNQNLESLKSTYSSTVLELESVSDYSKANEISLLTEKHSIISERLDYEDKRTECQNYLKNYNIQNDKCKVLATSSGYYYNIQDLKQGGYIQSGSSVGYIYPQDETDFYAEIYIDNADIGRVKEGQEVKFEIAAFPSSKYGYLIGEIENVSKDVTVDQSSGSAYYVVRAKCDEFVLKNKAGEAVSLKNGMACQGKVIIGDKTVASYLLEKIHLID